MTNSELREIIATMEISDDSNTIILEGDEFADGFIGLTFDGNAVYSYERLVDSLSSHNKWSREEALEWIEYNTLRAIPYMESKGKVPIIINEFLR